MSALKLTNCEALEQIFVCFFPIMGDIIWLWLFVQQEKSAQRSRWTAKPARLTKSPWWRSMAGPRPVTLSSACASLTSTTTGPTSFCPNTKPTFMPTIPWVKRSLRYETREIIDNTDRQSIGCLFIYLAFGCALVFLGSSLWFGCRRSGSHFVFHLRIQRN